MLMRISMIGLCLTGAAATTLTAHAEDVSAQLKKRVYDSAHMLEQRGGELEPWQKRIFTEEAVPQYQRFIRNYSSSSAGVKAEVDLASLRDYLRFYAPRALGTPVPAEGATAAQLARDLPKALLFVKVDPACAKCQASDAGSRGLLKSRVERRGFSPVWVSPQEAAALQPLNGHPLEAKLYELARARNLPAAGMMVLAQAPADEDHPGELSYTARSYFQVMGVGQSSGELELLENDAFETATAKLLSDAFTELGKDVSENGVASVVATPGAVEAQFANEPLVEVTDIRDYPAYAQIKLDLIEKLKGVSTVEERKISRGRAAFALKLSGSQDEVRSRLAGWDGVHWELK